MKKIPEAKKTTLFGIRRQKQNGTIEMVTYRNGKPWERIGFPNITVMNQYIEDHAEELYADVLGVPGVHRLAATGSSFGKKPRKIFKIIRVKVS